MATVGTGDAPLPLSCSRRTAGLDGVAGEELLTCSGWGHELTAMVDGQFTLSTAGDARTARTSRGVCSPI
ncbi:MAG: hypothetical protein AAF677_11030 [Pseudomonadota bacterium]